MKMKHYMLGIAMAAVAATGSLQAQDMKTYGRAQTPLNRFYFTNSADAALFSTSVMKKTGFDSKFTTLRFSYFFNVGTHLNYDFNKHWGMFTGLTIRNLGFIEKIGDSTIKRRTYNIGIPVGIKYGIMQKQAFVFAGGGIDMPFNYKEKGFVKRSHKQKFNEWFSDRTLVFMPYLFTGVTVSSLTLKVQVYPTNFLNRDYLETKNGITTKPYDVYEKTNIAALSIGMNVPYTETRKKKSKRIFE